MDYRQLNSSKASASLKLITPISSGTLILLLQHWKMHLFFSLISQSLYLFFLVITLNKFVLWLSQLKCIYYSLITKGLYFAFPFYCLGGKIFCDWGGEAIKRILLPFYFFGFIPTILQYIRPIMQFHFIFYLLRSICRSLPRFYISPPFLLYLIYFSLTC